MNRRGKNDEYQYVRHTLIQVILLNVLIIAVTTVFISWLAIGKSDEALKTKVTSLSSELNIQMKMNINNFLSKMETTGTLVFSSKEAHTYDATTENADGYEALATEKSISDTLYSLCIMDNYVDFAIVYRNNHSVGKLSNGTNTLFGDNLYNGIESYITRERTSDGWFTGYEQDYKRIYYVKRIHDNAVLVTSFYTTELQNVFDRPEDLSDMVVRLADEEYKIIYSSLGSSETGTKVPEEILKRANASTSIALMDDEYLITVDGCGNNWYVICSAPTQIILSEKNEVTFFISVACIISAAVAVIVSIILARRILDPVSKIVMTLNTRAQQDLATGLLNKKSFEDTVRRCLESVDNSGVWMLILIDIDNFKTINDTFGHSGGDKAIVSIGATLKNIFRSNDYIGRIGGDEFAVIMRISTDKITEQYNAADKRCQRLCESIRKITVGEDESYHLSASVGAAFVKSGSIKFEELYKRADSVLYHSKENGKDRYTIYRSNEEKEL